MRFLAILAAFSAFLAIGGHARPAFALDRLDFSLPLPESSRIDINRFIETNLRETPDSLATAATDLNGDGLDEFIIRDKSCDRGAVCRFTILAETGDGMISLGAIDAHGLALGTTYVQGVRSLLALKNGVNDYDYAVYVWEPQQARYMMEK